MILSYNAQTYNLGSWNILNLKFSITNKISAFAEGQIRSLRFYDHFHYYEYKGGIIYRENDKLTLTLAAGSYQTYMEGGNFELPKNNDELRVWPQVSLFQYFGKLKVEQRYRAELRWTNSGYRNRFRYRLGFSYPLIKKSDATCLKINLNNEIFFTNVEPYFERNRMQFQFQFYPRANISGQIGYLHQFDYKINDETGNDFLVIGLNYEFGRKKN